jgi:hypothetical protein
MKLLPLPTGDALLVELLEEVRRIRGLLERIPAPESRKPLHVQDRRALERLLPVVAAQFADAFETWELFDVAGTDGVAGNDMRIALAGQTAHRLGKLLRRAANAGTAVAGLRVEAAGRHGAGGRWRCVAVPSAFSEPETHAKVLPVEHNTENTWR